ncbi:MAG TPA: fatty acyl-AMP ligase [Steroidobacteraceae bacterium]|nr:fatty acyl-AMP ligase [Steroidobacteraceae bacterium]
MTVVRAHAALRADAIAYTYLADGQSDARSLSWSELDARAARLGAALHGQGAAGEPVLLALPSGLAFIESLFACWYAGAIPVPVSLPLHQRAKHRLNSIIGDARARFALGSPETQARLSTAGSAEGGVPPMHWIDPNAAAATGSGAECPGAPDQRVALLQYTSGSTGAPRGVIVTHANLMHNSSLIAEAFGCQPGDTIAGWLPLFHDMGLIGLILQAAFTGQRCVFMSPERFLMRPWLWLQMISDYRACGSAAPNFAYELCAEKIGPEHKARLDLSCWRHALNGSEPLRPKSLARFAAAFRSCGFRPDAFVPCYGLAESTLFVTGPTTQRRIMVRDADGRRLSDDIEAAAPGGYISCGRVFRDTRLAIVDPQTCRPVDGGGIGEVWLQSESVCDGYWNNPEATAATFHGQLKDESGTGGGNWLRTGDLGFMVEGELFITGRLRDLIIIAGKNHFPIDIERTAETADPVIAASGVAAFSVDVDGAERLIIAAEVRREYGRPRTGQAAPDFDAAAVRGRIRTAVAAENEIAAHHVVLLRPGALPRTSSGKVSRSAARTAYLNQTLDKMESPIDAPTMA